MMKVILVDDEQYILSGLQTLIEWEKLACVVVGAYESAQQALCKMQEETPDVAILDIHMHGMTGLQLGKEIREKYPNCQIIFLTGYEDFSYAKTALDLGAIAYVLKTEALDELPEALKKAYLQYEKNTTPKVQTSEQEVLHALILGTYTEIENEQKNKEIQALNEKIHAFRFMTVEMKKTHKDVLEQCKRLFKTSFQAYAYVFVPLSSCKMGVVLTQNAMDGQQVKEKAERFVQSVQSFLSLNLIVSMSALYKDVRMLENAYEETKQLLLNIPKDSDKKVLITSESNEYLERTNDLTKRFIQQCTQMILEGEKENLALCIKNYVVALNEAYLTEVKSSAISVLHALDLLCFPYEKEGVSAPSNHAYKDVLQSKRLTEVEDILLSAAKKAFVVVHREQKKVYSLIEKTNDFIEQHAFEKITLQDIADAVHSNASHLSRFYKEKTSENLFDVINKKRLEKAVQLLLTTDLHAYEISEQVGFSDTSYFSRFFKKHMGMSPLQFIKKKGENIV